MGTEWELRGNMEIGLGFPGPAPIPVGPEPSLGD